MPPANSPVLIRLGKAADAGQTGVLHLSGESGGAIYLSQGVIAYAESGRAPDLSTRLEKAALAAPAGTVSSLERSWLAREATVDAVTEISSVKSRQARFRASAELDLSVTASMPVAVLITEVSRRHEVIRQMSAVLTADTAVARCPRLSSRAVRVSGLQWAIAIRAKDPVTPRGLALELGQSVFGTTVESFRMVSMGLLAVAGTPAGPPVAAGEPGRDRPAISFIRALAG
jgi:Domain of unknown function (DUF4388)